MSLTAWNRNSSLSLQSLVSARNSLPFVELEVRLPLTSPNLLCLSQSGDLKPAHLLALSDCLFSTAYQKTTLCRDSSVGIERERPFGSRSGQKTPFHKALEFTQPTLKWIPCIISGRVMRLECNSDHSPLSSAEINLLATDFFYKF